MLKKSDLIPYKTEIYYKTDVGDFYLDKISFDLNTNSLIYHDEELKKFSKYLDQEENIKIIRNIIINLNEQNIPGNKSVIVISENGTVTPFPNVDQNFKPFSNDFTDLG